jgi:hypothetical protein
MSFPSLKEITGRLFRAVQKILLAVLLAVIYFFGFGLTLALGALFNRKIIFARRKNKGSSWVRAEGYQPDLEDCLRQS